MQRKTCDYLLIRHLKPDVAAGICYGRTDLPPAETPDTAWRDLMARCDLPLLASPLQRAARLAEALQGYQSTGAGSGGIARSGVAYSTCWQELDFGLWEGQSWSQIGQQAVEQWQADLPGFCFPDGESAIQMQGRVLAGWRAWLQQERGGLLVCHQGVIRMLLGEVLQIPFAQQLQLQIHYQHGAWLHQSWLEDAQGERVSGSELWQLRGLNLSAKALADAWPG